ncbi:MHS family metabolite:H+ symporter-like MFS transporter [Paraburkholderia sp. BL8N3]|nr:MFS transporter [Paraburkholderia sp. BL8N3]TCK36562.1 MHS family metabolite:H+ symporter-like MFS transporter [Paraburkholderia sp. BL8N3]
MQTDHGKTLSRVALASVIGTTVEWYDFFLYGVIAGIVLNKLYFPTSDPLVSTLLAYTTFLVGFVARPLGGIVFGHFGDRVGRKSILVVTLVIMGVATAAIGLVPTYAQIGIWAPILLLVLRILQGIGLGGEWGGSVLMAFEYAPPEKRGFYASLPQMGVSIGLCGASGLVALLSQVLTEAQFLAWGWRVAFGASVILIAIGLWIRLKLMETPEFQAVKDRGEAVKLPFATLMSDFGRQVLLGLGIRYIEGVFFNLFAVFAIGYLTQQLSLTRTDALIGVMAAALVMCFFIPFFGKLSDRLGRARTFFWGAVICGCSVFPAFWLMSSQPVHVLAVWISIVIPFGVFYAIIYGPEAALFAELFEPHVRYTGISFVYQFSGIFASGLTPIIATILLRVNGGQPWLVCAYVVFAALVSAVCVARVGRSPNELGMAAGVAGAKSGSAK